MNNIENFQYPSPKQEYKVLVRCYTFNQSKYIEDALNGFAMQQTNFPFLCLVMDDASTDGEQDVIKKWMERECNMSKAETIEIPTSTVILVPHKTNASCTFAFYLLKQNLYRVKGEKKKHVDPWREKCEYEAICEGDDYWIDPLKLQKQVDFLETHLDYSMCFHKANVINESKKDSLNINIYNHLEEREYTGSEILEKWSIPTASVLARKGIVRPKDSRFIYGDIVYFLSCAEFGRIFCMNDLMSVYRRNDNGVTLKKYHYKKYINHYDAIIEHFGEKYANIISLLKIRSYVLCFIGARKSKNDLLEILKDVFHQKHLIIPFCLYLSTWTLKSIVYIIKNKCH